MARLGRARKAMPISVVVTAEQRKRFAGEAARRGLGVSSTMRALAIERIRELERDEQLERARRWQIGQMRQVMSRVDREGFRQATEAQIDALFEE